MSCSIYDIAKKSGVSIATVSRVLNNPASVREEKRNRVLDIINEMQYTPSATAQGLALNTTGMIGLSMSSAPFSMFESVYLLEFYHGVDTIFSRTPYDVVIINDTVDSLSSCPRFNEYIRKKKVDGMIFSTDQHIEPLLKSGLPVVYAGKAQPVQSPHVYASLHLYLKDVAKYFYNHGHRNIGFLCGNNTTGLCEAIKAECPDLQFNLQMQSVFAKPEELKDHLCDLLFNKKVTALFVEMISVAPMAVSLLQQAGLSVPDDVSIVTVEHVEGAAAEFYPAIDAVYVPALEMGASCANMLLDILEGTPVQKNEVIFHPQIIQRGSTSTK